MNYDNYNRWTEKINSNKTAMVMIHAANYLLTAAGFVMYPMLLCVIFYQGSLQKLILYILLPGLSFLVISIYRKIHNSPRPYEVYPIRPLITKEKTGRSFPSRHVFSIMTIGGLWFGIYPGVGILLLICGVVLAMIRVIGGVHFLRDVAWGSVLGILAAGLTYLSAFYLVN